MTGIADVMKLKNYKRSKLGVLQSTRLAESTKRRQQ